MMRSSHEHKSPEEGGSAMDREMKARLLGRVEKAKAGGGHEPDLVELRAPLEHPESVMRVFCTGCGNAQELTRENAGIHAEAAEVELPGNPEEHFFSVGACNLCDGDDEVIELRSFA